MPFISKPSISMVKDRGFAVSFAYDFQGDTATSQVFNGLYFLGSNVKIDMSAVANSPAHLPPFKCMQYAQEFLTWGSGSANLAGELFVNVPATGQLLRFGNPLAFQASSTAVTQTGANAVVCSGVVGLPTVAPSIINFARSQEFRGVTNNIFFGRLFVTLFTFDVAPWEFVSCVNLPIGPI